MNLIIKQVPASLVRIDNMVVTRDTFFAAEAIPIAIANWKEFDYVPSVTFKILHNCSSILLCYDVEEKHISAAYNRINEPVYKDSCVEFFISFDGNNYYNFEFNCIGTPLVGYGTSDKSSRILLPPEQVALIETDSQLHVTKTKARWTLIVQIPVALFSAHAIRSLKGLRCSGNFYKCGDDLPIPHFLSWNTINYPEPNFHLPQFFGELLFE